MGTITLNGQKLHIDGYLQKKLDNIKKVLEKKWDAVILIDGVEGSGKSTLSFICGWYITDGKLTLKNVAEGTQDAIQKLEKLPDKSTLIIDEGSLMFSSKDVMRKEQRTLIKILNVIRQKMMCLIIVAPSFFDLNKYISIDRSRFLLHVYTNKDLERGRFTYFGQKKKKLLYTLGKKNFNSYSKPRADFRGRFSNFDPFGEEYQELKRKSLKESFKEDEKKIAPLHQRWILQRNMIWKWLIMKNLVSQAELRRFYEKNGQRIPPMTMSDALKEVTITI